MGAKVKGVNDVVKRLNKFIDDTQGKKAARAAYMAMDAVALDAAVATPIDTSTLINSQYRQLDVQGGKIIGKIGYTAAYALAVHNASGKLKGKPRADFGVTRDGKAFGGGTKTGNYWDPHGEPQFLLKALKKNIKTIKEIYKKELKP